MVTLTPPMKINVKIQSNTKTDLGNPSKRYIKRMAIMTMPEEIIVPFNMLNRSTRLVYRHIPL